MTDWQWCGGEMIRLQNDALTKCQADQWINCLKDEMTASERIDSWIDRLMKWFADEMKGPP